MAVVRVIWHGTQAESTLLVDAIAHNCGCQFAQDGARTSTCTPHEAMLCDQRFMDGLIFMRRARDVLVQAEFQVAEQ